MEVNRNAPVFAETEIVIDAPQELVWQVLTDLQGWPQWYTEVSEVSVYGDFAPGTEFRWKASGVTILSQLEIIEPHSRLLWTGRSPGVRATHLWKFHEQGAKTLVHTEECFEGLLPRLLKGPLKRMLADSLESGTQSLKAACEKSA